MIVNSWTRSEYYRVKAALHGKVPTRMELFRMMKEPQYLSCIEKSKENIFRQYLDALEEMGELSAEDEELKNSIGGEFLHVLETTLMQKSYKMVILKAFFHDGNIRMALTEKDVLNTWKAFFSEGENWKDIGDEQHLVNARRNPIKYLLSSGKGFFVEKPGYELALTDDLKDIVATKGFMKQFGDIVEYRLNEYFRKKNLSLSV